MKIARITRCTVKAAWLFSSEYNAVTWPFGIPIRYEDYIALNGEAGAKSAGKLKVEGKEYIVQDGDVMHFRFNV